MIFLDANFLIYLNLGVSEVKEYYIKLLTYESLFSDPLVIDEVIYVSKKKYGVRYCDTIEFLDEIVLKYLTVLPITIKEYERAKEIMRKYSVRPSDAFHIAVMLNNSINVILSEDKELDKVVEIKRIWIK
ncbi:type II toxin-antitoxin system VapC family toxin [Saccharolobus caldissimus]|uniref:PIN domain nuclease n=1 Tax=Saccharolobus caldissimus TaxID=1702097 RepID=A0AAQ4CRU0_9CREN|nr:type II toxin-antitoxin system VapC family toxin [Saccharolobus caldissimus]BDB98521.1 PIN domain nuclease [Saccharolobus caldissimus]